MRWIWRLAVQVLGIAVAIGLWELASVTIGRFTMPSPVTTFETITDNFVHSRYLASHGLSEAPGYLPHLLYTVRNVVVGVLGGTAIGVTLGLASLRLPVISEVMAPIASTFGAAPVVVAAPFFLIWFGIVAFAQVLIVTSYTALLMYIFSRRAGDNVRPDYVESALTLGAGPWAIFRRVYVPATIPEIIAGFRISLAGAWGLEAIAELLGSQRGAGLVIKFYANAFVVDGMLALVLLLGLVSVLLDRITVVAGRQLTRWSEAGHALQL